MTKKDIARSKRQAVMASTAYQHWLEHRRKIHPFPSDPYRAFMIDLSLAAQRKGEDKWESSPNRLDIDIDYPRRGIPYGKLTPIQKARGEKISEKLPEKARSHMAQMAQFYGVELGKTVLYHRPNVKVGAYGYYSPSTGEIHVALGSHERPRHVGAIYTSVHEVGHLVHHKASEEQLRKLGIERHDVYAYGRDVPKTVYSESTATRLAKKYARESGHMKPIEGRRISWIGALKTQLIKEKYGVSKQKEKIKWSFA